MMDDHLTISRARNEACNALQVFLNPGIMDEVDFRKFKMHTQRQLDAVNELLYGTDRLSTGWGRLSKAFFRAYFFVVRA